jgi:hypothetical protein
VIGRGERLPHSKRGGSMHPMHCFHGCDAFCE